MPLQIETISERKPICLWHKPRYFGQSDRNWWNSAGFSFPPRLQILRNFHKIMHDSKFGRNGSFLIVLKKHHVRFFEVLGTQLFKTDRQSRDAFQVAKLVIIWFAEFLGVFFTSRWFKSHFWEFRRNGSFWYGFVGKIPEFDWYRTTSGCITIDQSRDALRHV